MGQGGAHLPSLQSIPAASAAHTDEACGLRWPVQEAMATARGAAEAGALDTPIMPPIVEPSAEEGAAKKKTKKRKAAEADAVQAQAAEAAQDDGGAAPGGWFSVCVPWTVNERSWSVWGRLSCGRHNELRSWEIFSVF